MGIHYRVWEAFPKSKVRVEYEISNHLPRLGFNLLINISLFIDITYNALCLLRFEFYHRKALEFTFCLGQDFGAQSCGDKFEMFLQQNMFK